ncbi:hypothetical protein AX14_002177 [Amanita brunnescens Koide BX004]|nr:hypothetical protein AX14_002177 [Amanita brunnescens Koide BX004]
MVVTTRLQFPAFGEEQNRLTPHSFRQVRQRLDSYRTTLNQEEPLPFFCLQEFPQPSVDQELLSNANADAMQQDRHADLITYLDFAMIPKQGETVVDYFVVKLFKAIGYVRRARVARTGVDLPLPICGENRRTRGWSTGNPSMRMLSL